MRGMMRSRSNRGRKQGSGERSNSYSESKYTNWTRYDPYWSEAMSACTMEKPAATVKRGIDQNDLPIYARSDVHREFIRPISIKDVKEVLEKVPTEFLSGLRAVYLLRGTAKQAKSPPSVQIYRANVRLMRQANW